MFKNVQQTLGLVEGLSTSLVTLQISSPPLRRSVVIRLRPVRNGDVTATFVSCSRNFLLCSAVGGSGAFACAPEKIPAKLARMSDNKKDGDAPSTSPDAEGGEVISLDEVRRRLDEQMQKQAAESSSPQPPTSGDAPAAPANNFLAPVMAAIAQQLQGLAGPDGVVRLQGGTDQASREKTAAVLKGLGVGLGAALAEAFGKWADKIQIKVETTPPSDGKGDAGGKQPQPGATDPDKPQN